MMEYNPESRIKELNLQLPEAPAPGGVYKPVVVADHCLYVSGQAPIRPDGSLITGRVGENLSLEEGKEAARRAGAAMLATIKAHYGDLSNIRRLLKTLGMVNCTPDFAQQPEVINGFSELMAEVFGDENGIGARSAVGMMLPGNIAVEVEAIFEIKEAGSV